MRTYALLTDNFRRLLMRCPDCHKCWKTGETWEQLAQKARDDRAMQLDALYRKAPEGGTVVYMSGREDRHREETQEWLKKHDLFRAGSFLYMRESGDFRKDAIVKRELFDRLVNPNFRIEFVLDDRDQVVEMWRACGLTCFQVAEGNF